MTDDVERSVDGLKRFIDRASAILAEPPATRPETRAWLVDPFLATLGWDVGGDEVTADVVVDGTALAYVCRIDATPALFVAAEPATDSLVRERAIDLGERMRATGVDRSLYTNGREFVFAAGRNDVESTACSLADLTAYEAVLEAFSAPAARDRLAGHSRPLAARRLAVERRSLVEGIADELAAAAGEAHRTEFESAADRFVADLREAFLSDGRDRAVGTVLSVGDDSSDMTVATPDEAGGGEADSPGNGSTGTDDSTASRHVASTAEFGAGDATVANGATSNAREEGVAEFDDEGGEYVVRFFDEGRSIGAIGHSTAAGALVHAAEFLLERGLSGVRLPWTSEDGTVALAAGGSDDAAAMTAPRELSNGYVLETAGSVRDRAERVEALADRAGLDAMCTGDWQPVR